MSGGTLPEYRVRATNTFPELASHWNDAAWAAADIAHIAHFRPESSTHRPVTQLKLLHGPGGLRGIFRIDDQYVRSIRTGFQSEVFKDSCVEFFFQPKTDKGYFNLEMNAGGSHLSFFIEDATRTATGFVKFQKLSPEDGAQYQVHSTLPPTVDPEIPGPISWEQNFFIPYALLEKYIGPMGSVSHTTWRGNFFKCAEDLSHPHWAAWAAVDEFNFHLPRCFGMLRFE